MDMILIALFVCSSNVVQGIMTEGPMGLPAYISQSFQPEKVPHSHAHHHIHNSMESTPGGGHDHDLHDDVIPIMSSQPTTNYSGILRDERVDMSYKPKSGQLQLEGMVGDTFTLFQKSSYIKIEPNSFNKLNTSRGFIFSFLFRTKSPRGLLLHHMLDSTFTYELLVSIDMGRVRATFILPSEHFNVTVGRGLNDDEWHNLTIEFLPENDLNIRGQVVVDDESSRYYTPLSPQIRQVLQSSLQENGLIYIGGLGSITKGDLSPKSFIGCIKAMKLLSGADVSQITSLTSFEYEYVLPGCVDKCQDQGSNRCHGDSKCINHYTMVTCDCFSTKTDGSTCSDQEILSINLNGDNFVSYRQYDMSHQHHQSQLRVSFMFKTTFDNSILFFSEGPSDYLVVSLLNTKVNVTFQVDYDNRNIVFEDSVTDNAWHNFTFVLRGKKIQANLDTNLKTEVMTTDRTLILLSPEVFYGGIPSYTSKKGVSTLQKFAGCMQQVYLNEVSILKHLQTGCPKTKFVGRGVPMFGQCEERNTLPISFPTPESLIWITPRNEEDDFEMSVELSYPFQAGVMLSGGVELITGQVNPWEVITSPGLLKVIFINDIGEKKLFLSTPLPITENSTIVGIKQLKGRLQLLQNDIPVASTDFRKFRKIVGPVYLGGTTRTSDEGYVGCISVITLQGHRVDPREAFTFNQVQGIPSLDGCLYLHPCADPRVCQHGGQCNYIGGETTCSCEDTGYEGVRCQFAKYKRSCDELREIGIHMDGEYLVDIDGSGPLPPAPLWCNFSQPITTFQIHNNVPEGMVVRGSRMEDAFVAVTYRGFTPDMLTKVITQSEGCHQEITYSCHNAALRPGLLTWFEAQDIHFKIDKFQNITGSCRCHDEKCIDPHCVCDNNSHGSDQLTLEVPYHIGISKMYFLHDEKGHHESIGKVTLGPVECQNKDSTRNTLRFAGGADSYLTLLGHYTHLFTFSFRTRAAKSLLLLQPPSHVGTGGMMVTLEDPQILLIETWINDTTHPRHVISDYPVDDGDWHVFSVELSQDEYKFSLDANVMFSQVKDGEQLGPFEGPIYLGGIPEYLRESLDVVASNMIGCLRGIKSGNVLISLKDSVDVYHRGKVKSGCELKCHPNPCLNHGVCEETWDSYKCHCLNSHSQSGQHCELDLVGDALTIYKTDAFYYNLTTDISAHKEHIFRDSISLNFRTTSPQGLLFYAYDNLNNFIQLHIQDQTQLIFTCNSGERISQAVIFDPKLTSGDPMQVYITRKETLLTLSLNRNKEEIISPNQPLRKYIMMPWVNPELETVHPIRGVLPSIDYSLLLLGGSNKSVSTSIPGFVGCIRGLKIDDRTFDLNSIAQQVEGMKPGCNMYCDEKPCRNGGDCVENFLEHSYKCNCLETSYHGDQCQQDNAVGFDGGYLAIPYQVTPWPSSLSLHFGFATTAKQESDLLGMVFTDGFLILQMTSDGHLLIRSNVGGELVTYVTKAVNDGKRHALVYEQTLLQGKHRTDLLKLDHEVVDGTDETHNDLYTELPSGKIYIGGRALVGNNSNSLFQGCLSNLHLQLGERVIDLIELLENKIGVDIIKVTTVPSRVTTCPVTLTSLRNSAALDDYRVISGTAWDLNEAIRVELPHAKDVHTAETSKLPLILGLCAALIALLLILILLLKTYKSRKNMPESRLEEVAFLNKANECNKKIPCLKISQVNDSADISDASKSGAHQENTNAETDKLIVAANDDETDAVAKSRVHDANAVKNKDSSIPNGKNRYSEVNELKWVATLDRTFSASHGVIEEMPPMNTIELDPRAPLSSTSEVTLYSNASRPNSLYFTPTSQLQPKRPN